MEIIISIKAFRDSDAGIASGRAALDAALAAYPKIDKSRIYAAGHSAAATLALLLAAKDERIKAVAAFAPVTNLTSWFPEQARNEIDQALPGFGDFLKSSSPITHASALATKPVFLFHAMDDQRARPEESEHLFAAMTNRHKVCLRGSSWTPVGTTIL